MAWQSIITAPRDGTMSGVWHYLDFGICTDMYDFFYPLEQVKYWMPLPDYPYSKK